MNLLVDVAAHMLVFCGATPGSRIEISQRLESIVTSFDEDVAQAARSWLSMCPGTVLPDGQSLLGAEPTLPDYLRIERVLDIYPGFGDSRWLPIADDGCGNYWVVHPTGVIGFVDCSEDCGSLSYQAASDLGRFLIPFLIPSLDQRGWPFDRMITETWDEGIGRTPVAPQPWPS